MLIMMQSRNFVTEYQRRACRLARPSLSLSRTSNTFKHHHSSSSSTSPPPLSAAQTRSSYLHSAQAAAPSTSPSAYDPAPHPRYSDATAPTTDPDESPTTAQTLQTAAAKTNSPQTWLGDAVPQVDQTWDKFAIREILVECVRVVIAQTKFQRSRSLRSRCGCRRLLCCLELAGR